MASTSRIISADSHLQLAPERWTPRIPAQYRDQAPRGVRMPNGADAAISEGSRPAYCYGNLTGRPYESRSPNGGLFATAPGYGSPEQRLQEQDIDGIDGEVLFTSPAFAGASQGVKGPDNAAYKAMIHAWNEFLAEEYCAAAPERLIGMGVMPDSGVEDALAELEYCARMGLKGVSLSQYPSGKDIPSPEDDRFWAAALDLNMPITVHVSFTGGRAEYPYDQDLKAVASGVDPFSKFTQYAVRGAGNALQMIFTGVFDRFPRLHIYFAETQVGWIPHFLEILDDQYDRHIHWSDRLGLIKKLNRLPSEYIREHFWWGFMRNAVGVRHRHDIGVTQMMWASDFPHGESDWPDSQEIIDEIFAGVPDDERALMLGGNAVNYFHLAPAIQSQRRATTAAPAVP